MQEEQDGGQKVVIWQVRLAINKVLSSCAELQRWLLRVCWRVHVQACRHRNRYELSVRWDGVSSNYLAILLLSLKCKRGVHKPHTSRDGGLELTHDASTRL